VSGPLRLVGCPPVGCSLRECRRVWQVIAVLVDCTSGITDMHKGCGFRPLLGCHMQSCHGLTKLNSLQGLWSSQASDMACSPNSHTVRRGNCGPPRPPIRRQVLGDARQLQVSVSRSFLSLEKRIVPGGKRQSRRPAGRGRTVGSCGPCGFSVDLGG